MPKDRRSFFERLTGSISSDPENIYAEEISVKAPLRPQSHNIGSVLSMQDEDSLEDAEIEETTEDTGDDEGQLTVDVYQTPTHIVIQSTIAGVKPEDLDVSITQDMITIKGTREQHRDVTTKNYYYQELYWGSFSRSILLPQEVDSEAAEASIKHGLLTIRLPKLDKNRTQKLRIKNE